MAAMAELLVGALQPALVQFGLTELFVGVIASPPSATQRSITPPSWRRTGIR